MAHGQWSRRDVEFGRDYGGDDDGDGNKTAGIRSMVLIVSMSASGGSGSEPCGSYFRTCCAFKGTNVIFVQFYNIRRLERVTNIFGGTYTAIPPEIGPCDYHGLQCTEVYRKEVKMQISTQYQAGGVYIDSIEAFPTPREQGQIMNIIAFITSGLYQSLFWLHESPWAPYS